MEVKFLDLTRQYKTIKKEVAPVINLIIESQQFINGSVVSRFERNFADYCETNYAVGVSSGTDALLISLMSLGVGPGDEVITTPFTFFATVEVIIRVGATPVFVDIDEDTFNIDVELIEQAITDKTKAIIPVHLFGQCANMTKINEIAQKYDLLVIEDAAQAIGSTWKDQKAGSMGKVGCFSFFPSKNLGGFGDGGMVTTNDEELYDLLMRNRQHGINPAKKYKYESIGGNFRLDALQAGVLDVKLKYIDKWTKMRQKNAYFYEKSLKNVLNPFKLEDSAHVYNQYTIRTENRDMLQKKLKKDKIGCAIYYPNPIHLLEHLKHYGYREGDLPNCEKVCKDVLSLPIYPEITKKELQCVVEAVNSL